MDFQRTLLFAALSLIMFMFWQTWQFEHQPQITTVTQTQQSVTSSNQQPPQITEPSSQVPLSMVPTVTETISTTLPGTQFTDVIKVTTDVFNLEIAKQGGKIIKLELRKYPLSINNLQQNFSLLQTASKPFYLAENGIVGIKGTDKNLLPDHNANFSSNQDNYVLQGENLKVALVWQGPTGLTITKTYQFVRDSYQIKVIYHIVNNTAKVWQGSVYGQLQRQGLLESEEMGLTNYSYTGAVYYTKKDSYKKLSFADLDEQNLDKLGQQAWVGYIQHYFTGAIIPSTESLLYSYKSDNKFIVGVRMELLTVAAGSSKIFEFKMFLGPKLQDKMEQAAKGLKLTVDYGWLAIIGEPIFWLLKKIHGVVPNWGLAIILVTLLLKLLFFKLSATSYKSMAKMRKLQPKIAVMKQRFSDDKQKMQQAMMKMYKDEKVNPMGGCLPILVQMPVFIALYWVLLESVELRMAPFLWIEDLSIKDPFYILPLLMGISMFIQQRLNPTPPDPVQAKIMMFLPVVFTVFFAFFPAGLVLYWTTNNILSISQQWVITNKYGGVTKK